MSECIFICTSNSIANMLQPLIDRIEVIHVPAYLPIEKLNIAKQYLIPQLEKEYNFICDNEPGKHPLAAESATPITAPAETPSKKKAKKEPKEEKSLAIVNPHERVSFTDASVMDIINHYCHHEAGVRNLRKALDRVFRKIVTRLDAAEVKTEDSQADGVEYQINTRNVEKFLDVSPTDDTYFEGINK